MLSNDDNVLISPVRSGKRPSPATTTSNRLLEPWLPTHRNPHINTKPATNPPPAGMISLCHHAIASATSPRSPG